MLINFPFSTTGNARLPVVTINWVHFSIVSVGLRIGVFTTRFFNFDEGVVLRFRNSFANIIPTYLPSLSITGSWLMLFSCITLSAFAAVSSNDNAKTLSTIISEIFILVYQKI